MDKGAINRIVLGWWVFQAENANAAQGWFCFKAFQNKKTKMEAFYSIFFWLRCAKRSYNVYWKRMGSVIDFTIVFLSLKGKVLIQQHHIFTRCRRYICMGSFSKYDYYFQQWSFKMYVERNWSLKLIQQRKHGCTRYCGATTVTLIAIEVTVSA